MAYLKAIAGVLAIMAASGMILDYDLAEKDSEIRVRVWLPEEFSGDLRQDVALFLARDIGHRTIVVTEG